MQPQTKSVTGVGTSPIQAVTPQLTPVNCSVQCVVTGTVSYTLQYTFDKVGDPAVTPLWWNDATIATKTDNQKVFIDFPVMAFRINNASGSGSVTMTVLQAGIAGN